jgi:peptide/nickel transport system permease protein
MRFLFARPRLQLAGIALLLAVILFGLLGPLIWPDYAAQELTRFLEPPSLAEPLGRDQLGRSSVARLAYATRLSLGLSLLCVITAALIGSACGVLASWRGGWIDVALRSLADGVLALPGLLIVLIFSAMAQGGFWTLYIGLALAQWVEYFRLVRARSRLILASPHVEAARLLGFGPLYIVRRHLWPELRALLTTLMVFGMATAVLALSTLGYIGVGLQPPTPELGLMMTEAFPHYHEAPRMVMAPVMLLAITLTGLVLIQGKETPR